MDPLRSVRELDTTKQALLFLDEFKTFALKGNVIDLAVGVIIGAAFGKIVDSLVKQIIMPLIGTILPGKQGYLDWKWVIHGKPIPYGLFLGEVVNFLIVALALFLFIVKFLGWLMHQESRSRPSPSFDQRPRTPLRDPRPPQAARGRGLISRPAARRKLKPPVAKSVRRASSPHKRTIPRRLPPVEGPHHTLVEVRASNSVSPFCRLATKRLLTISTCKLE